MPGPNPTTPDDHFSPELLHKLHDFAQRISVDSHTIIFNRRYDQAPTLDALTSLLETTLNMAYEIIMLQHQIDPDATATTPITLHVQRGFPNGQKLDSS